MISLFRFLLLSDYIFGSICDKDPSIKKQNYAKRKAIGLFHPISHEQDTKG